MRLPAARRGKILAVFLALFLLMGFLGYFWASGFNPRLPILMYHHILRESENRNHTDNPYVVSLESFEEQMRYLYDNGYKTVTSAELLSFLDGGKLPEKRVMLTFDDGYYSNFTYAYPILKEYGFTAVIFAVTSWVSDDIKPLDPDKFTFINWPEMEEYSDVFEFAGHTHSMHTQTDEIPALLSKSKAEIAQDIQKSLDFPLISDIGFSYPYGKYSSEVIEVLKELGIKYAVTTKARYVTASANPYKLPRFAILRETTFKEFVSIVSGA